MPRKGLLFPPFMKLPSQPVINELVRALPTGAVHLTEEQEVARVRMELTLVVLENELLHERIKAMSNSPPWPATLRPRVLRLMRLRGEGATRFAQRMRLSKSTIMRWKRLERVGTGGSAAVYNRLSDAVRRAVHEVKALLPEVGVGSRALTQHLRRNGVDISRSSLQRILREVPPRLAKLALPKNPLRKPETKPKPLPKVVPYGPLRPKAKNEVWHLDLTTKRIWWVAFTIAALMDGKTRKCLGLDLFAKVPGSEELLAMIEDKVGKFGKPGAVITDRGGQFQAKFGKGLLEMGIGHLKGRARRPQFNGKVERLFRSLKFVLVKRLIWLPYDYAGLQSVLHDWQDWYNRHRPHQALDGQTPDDVWHGRKPKPPTTYRARDRLQPKFHLSRHDHRGLACCPVLTVEVEVAA